MVVSIEQISEMVEIMEGNHELALGRCARTKEGRSLAKRMWQEAANRLNSVSLNCDTKSPEEWRIYYNDYKHKVQKKIKKMKGEFSGTGSGPSKNITLTTLEYRLFNILGWDVGDPLLGVRRNPLCEVSAHISQPVEVLQPVEVPQLMGVLQPMEVQQPKEVPVAQPIRTRRRRNRELKKENALQQALARFTKIEEERIRRDSQFQQQLLQCIERQQTLMERQQTLMERQQDLMEQLSREHQ